MNIIIRSRSKMERTKARTQHLDNKILFKIQELHGPRLDKAMTFLL